MKRPALLIFVLACTFCTVTAQREWAPIGAEWYYGYMQGSYEPSTFYLKMVSLKDTTVGGKTSRLLRSTIVTDVDQIHLEDIVIYQDQDKIYRWADGAFHILYDFSLQVGDTLKVYIPNPISQNPSFNFAYLTVVSLSEFDISDRTFRSQLLWAIDKELSVYAVQFSHWAHESIGSQSYFIPVHQLVCDNVCPWPLRCYSESNLSFKWIDIPCDTIIILRTGINQTDVSDKVKLFPNPVKQGDQVKVEIEGANFPDDLNIQLTGIYGRKYGGISRVRHSFLEISTDQLAPGIYFLIVTLLDNNTDILLFS